MCIYGKIDKTTVGKSVIAYRYFTIGRSGGRGGLLRAYVRDYKYAPPKLGRKPVYTTTDDPTLDPNMGFHAYAKREIKRHPNRRVFRVRLSGTVVHHKEYGMQNPKAVGFRATRMVILNLLVPASRTNRRAHAVEQKIARRYHIKIDRRPR